MKKPAGPKAFPFVGPLALMNDTVAFLPWARRYGDVVYCETFGNKVFLVYRPDLAEHVLVRNQKNYKKDIFIQRAGAVFGEGLLRADGERWLTQRRLMQPAFHRQRIEGYAETMRRLAEDFVAKMDAGKDAEFHALMTSLTLEIAVQTMFGQSTAEETAAVHDLFAVISERFEAVGHFIEPPWWPSRSNRRYLAAIGALDKIIDRFIETRRDQPGEDLLSLLLETKDEAGQPMSAQQLRDEVMTLFLAGHETTALTLVYAWRLLALHPDIAVALHAQTRDVALTLSGVSQVPLLDQVMKETLRLYPPVYAIPRESIGQDELGGFTIPPGAQIIIALNAMHRDPDTFADPDVFRPERWTPQFEQGLHRYAFFPFGGGPRQCIGAMFAQIEAKIVLVTLLRRFVPHVLSDAPLRLVASITARPAGGLPVKLTARPLA